MAQRKAGLSVQSRCHDRAPNLSRRRDHGQTRRHSQAPRGVRWPLQRACRSAYAPFRRPAPPPQAREAKETSAATDRRQGSPQGLRLRSRGSRGGVKASAGRTRPPGRRGASGGSRQPPGRKRRSKKPNGSTTESSHHRNRASRSKNDRKLRISVGRSRRRSWRPLFVERETRRSARSFVHLTRASALVLCRHTWCNGPDRSCDPEWARLPAVSPCPCRRRI